MPEETDRDRQRWHPALIAAAVLAALALAAVPLYFMALQMARAARAEAEAARLAAEEAKMRKELERLAEATGRARGAGDLAKVQGETQGLLFRIREGPPRPGLLADTEALAARKRKEWLRLNRRAGRFDEKRRAKNGED
jgi:hypothetical protein